MDKTMEAALGVFGELRDKLQVTEVAELKKDLITDLDLRLKSISADALSYVKYGKASEVQRFQLKQSFVLAAACSAVDA